MQLLDSSDLGLRSARLTLRSATSNVIVTLFPMIHLGEAAFYEAVRQDAGTHDAVLVEGVHSPVMARITRSYRWIEGARQIALVVQPHLRAPLQAEIIHADLSVEEFERHWGKVPFHLRTMFAIAGPIYALYHRWFGSRGELARGHALDDLPSRSEALSWTPEFASFDEVILVARDKRLVETMGIYLDNNTTSEPRRLAIVYGAQHMRAVLKELTHRGFHCVQSEWMLIFSLESKGGSA